MGTVHAPFVQIWLQRN